MEDGPFTAHGVQSQPYIYPEEIELDPKTPSCAQCKDKNYTRTYCRTNKKHRTLPWSTVYAVLSGPPQGGGVGGIPSEYRSDEGGDDALIHRTSTVDEEDSLPKKKIKTNQGDALKVNPDDGTDESSTKNAKVKDQDDSNESSGFGEETKAKTKDKNDNNETEGEEDSDEEEKDKNKIDTGNDVKAKDFVDIFKNPHPSKTFLATVSLTKNEVRVSACLYEFVCLEMYSCNVNVNVNVDVLVNAASLLTLDCLLNSSCEPFNNQVGRYGPSTSSFDAASQFQRSSI
jgi:hypothetical protein